MQCCNPVKRRAESNPLLDSLQRDKPVGVGVHHARVAGGYKDRSA